MWEKAANAQRVRLVRIVRPGSDGAHYRHFLSVTVRCIRESAPTATDTTPRGRQSVVLCN